MMIALPTADGSFTCTLFWPFQGPNSFAALTTEKDVIAYFQDQFPDAVPLIPTLGQDFLNNPTASLVTISFHPWHVNRRPYLPGTPSPRVLPVLALVLTP